MKRIGKGLIPNQDRYIGSGPGSISRAAFRRSLGLGTAAPLDGGNQPFNLVQLNGSSQYPALDGSLILNVSPPGYVSGLIPTAISGTNTTAAVTISSGLAVDTNGFSMKSAGHSWQVSNGNAANGYQGGTTLPNASTIHFFEIGGSGVSPASFSSTSLTPTLPGSYTTYKRIFSLRTDSAGALVPGSFREKGGGAIECLYAASRTLNAGTAVPITATLYTCAQAPTGIVVDLIVDVYLRTTAANQTYYLFASPSEPDDAPTGTSHANMAVGDLSSQPACGQRFTLRSNTSAQYRGRASGTASQSVYMYEVGFVDSRV